MTEPTADYRKKALEIVQGLEEYAQPAEEEQRLVRWAVLYILLDLSVAMREPHTESLHEYRIWFRENPNPQNQSRVLRAYTAQDALAQFRADVLYQNNVLVLQTLPEPR